jgi:hypothetical protein
VRRSCLILALAIGASILSLPAEATSHDFFLPWNHDVTRKVTCGNGCSRHTGGDQYAWDFEGDLWLVRAARTGTVVAWRDTFGEGADTDFYRDRANFVRILHSDGTETLYTHLKQGSVSEFGLVTGQVVVRHSIIGRTDSSGRVTGPHLHYQRQENCSTSNGFCNSLASSFADAGIPTTNQVRDVGKSLRVRVSTDLSGSRLVLVRVEGLSGDRESDVWDGCVFLGGGSC